jgi:hypothetical protein
MILDLLLNERDLEEDEEDEEDEEELEGFMFLFFRRKKKWKFGRKMKK